MEAQYDKRSAFNPAMFSPVEPEHADGLNLTPWWSMASSQPRADRDSLASPSMLSIDVDEVEAETKDTGVKIMSVD